MFYKGHIISNDTLSIIVTNGDKTATLSFFKKQKVIFEKTYKTFSAAKCAQTKKISDPEFQLFLMR